MDCPPCAAGLQASLQSRPGVVAARVEYDKGRGSVTYQPEQTSPDAIVQFIATAGLKARVEGPSK